MSRNRLNRPADESNKSEGNSDKKIRKQKITNSSRELNTNEEYTTPSGQGRKGNASNQMSQDRDRSTGRMTSPTERPELSNQDSHRKQSTKDHQQTTGSNTPGSRIGDKNNPNTDEWNQTSRDQFPKASKSSPKPTQENPEDQTQDGRGIKRPYTGNSERTGQQYSVKGNSTEIPDKDLKAGHPSNDRTKIHDPDITKRSRSSNKGMEERSAPAQRRDQVKNKNQPKQE